MKVTRNVRNDYGFKLGKSDFHNVTPFAITQKYCDLSDITLQEVLRAYTPFSA